VIILSDNHLSPSYSFVFSLSITIVPKTIHEAFNHPGRRQAMIDKMQGFARNDLWELFFFPLERKQLDVDGSMLLKLGHKTQLVAKGYTQIYGLDYYDTIFPMAKINTVRFFLAIATIRHWSLHQLDIKKYFLVVILREKIYIEQPARFFAQRESSILCKLHASQWTDVVTLSLVC